VQTQVRQDLLDHRPLQDRCNDLRLAAAIRAVFGVELNEALVRSLA